MTTRSLKTLRRAGRKCVLSLAPMALVVVLAGCGDANDDPADGAVRCDVLRDQVLVPFGTADTRLVYEIDYPQGWSIDQSAFETLKTVSFFRTMSAAHGDEILFTVTQAEQTSEPAYPVYKDTLGYEHTTDIDFGGQTIEVVGKVTEGANEQWHYLAWLPTPEGRTPAGHVMLSLTIQQGSDAGVRCNAERKALFDDIVQTIRPNPQTTYGQGD